MGAIRKSVKKVKKKKISKFVRILVKYCIQSVKNMDRDIIVNSMKITRENTVC